ncbi:unnamed protein product [Auanema sp. JU1783]|nr:unnamed protein product [Auanema sp. JU1783]
MKKKVAIIGAGASGLPAIRHALLYNVDVQCFESSDDVGGLWRYKPTETDESSVMKTTVINTSKEMTAYSDFPPPPETANFMHNTEMYKYLKDYAKHHGLMKYIKFNHTVQNVEKSDSHATDGSWLVHYTDNDNKKHQEKYDAVLLCSGHHTTPYTPPEWPGQASFKGQIIHSHSYKDHRGYEDKTVVVVGIGNSGGDIAVELSRICKQVYLVIRRGTWVLNRIYEYGQPFDLALSTKLNGYLTQYIPSSISSRFVEHKLNKRFDHERFGLKPAHRFFGAHPTVNDELPNRIASGTVRVKPGISEFTATGLKFVDGSRLENVDAVILATGFSFSFPMAENGKLIPVNDNHVNLYKYMYPLETSKFNTIAVIGLVQPFGSIMPIAEMQTRLFYENLFGQKCVLPSKEEMERDVFEKKHDMSLRYVESRRHTIQVDYVRYMDELADLIGCNPNLKKLFKTDFKLALKVLLGPTVPYVYRLEGPHAWVGAKKAIETVDERVFKATGKGEYQSSSVKLWICLIVLLVFLLLLNQHYVWVITLLSAFVLLSML